MKTVSQLAGGGAILPIWRRIPWLVRFPFVFGLGVVAASELNIDLNRSLRSLPIFGGKAAEGQAQIDDPTRTRKDMAARKPVTGADALVATQVDEGDADAKSKQAKAGAATESADEIEAKEKRGEKLTVVERMQWLDVQIAQQDVVIKQAEARTKAAEAQIKEAEASAAQAKADIVTAKVTQRVMSEDPAQAARELMSATDPFGSKRR
jgi:hypothetical protein